MKTLLTLVRRLVKSIPLLIISPVLLLAAIAAMGAADLFAALRRKSPTRTMSLCQNAIPTPANST